MAPQNFIFHQSVPLKRRTKMHKSIEKVRKNAFDQEKVKDHQEKERKDNTLLSTKQKTYIQEKRFNECFS